MEKEKAKECLEQAYSAYVECRATGANREEAIALRENYLQLRHVLPMFAGLNRIEVDEIASSAEEAFAAHFEAC